MTANLPVVDPTKITAPVIILRGEYDGIASLPDLLAFFARLPSPDRQFTYRWARRAISRDCASATRTPLPRCCAPP